MCAKCGPFTPCRYTARAKTAPKTRTKPRSSRRIRRLACLSARTSAAEVDVADGGRVGVDEPVLAPCERLDLRRGEGAPEAGAGGGGFWAGGCARPPRAP